AVAPKSMHPAVHPCEERRSFRRRKRWHRERGLSTSGAPNGHSNALASPDGKSDRPAGRPTHSRQGGFSSGGQVDRNAGGPSLHGVEIDQHFVRAGPTRAQGEAEEVLTGVVAQR